MGKGKRKRRKLHQKHLSLLTKDNDWQKHQQTSLDSKPVDSQPVQKQTEPDWSLHFLQKHGQLEKG